MYRVAMSREAASRDVVSGARSLCGNAEPVVRC